MTYEDDLLVNPSPSQQMKRLESQMKLKIELAYLKNNLVLTLIFLKYRSAIKSLSDEIDL